MFHLAPEAFVRGGKAILGFDPQIRVTDPFDLAPGKLGPPRNVFHHELRKGLLQPLREGLVEETPGRARPLFAEIDRLLDRQRGAQVDVIVRHWEAGFGGRRGRNAGG